MLKRYLLFIITIFLVIILHLYHSVKKAELNVNKMDKSELEQPANKYVILSSNVNPRYLFLLPFTAATWKKLGVQPIVVLIENNMESKSILKIQSTIKLLKEMNVTIQYLTSKKLSPTSLSQIIRLFGATLPAFQKLLTNDSILITSDADLAVFNLSNHVPDVSNGKALHLYNANCCKPINVPPMRGQHKVKQHSMGTIGATVTAWKEIMEFNRVYENMDEIENYITLEFGEYFFHASDEYFKEKDKMSSFTWYADQSLISYKIDMWRKKFSNEKAVSESTTLPRRINRNNWPIPDVFLQLNVTDFDDCHLPIAPYKPNQWKTFLPFLKFAFRDNITLLKRFVQYKKAFY